MTNIFLSDIAMQIAIEMEAQAALNTTTVEKAEAICDILSSVGTQPSGKVSDERVTLAECPIGLFESGGELCLKTEYGNNEGRIDSYIVSSGEFFWGGASTPAEQRKVLVRPVSAQLPARPVVKPDTNALDLTSDGEEAGELPFDPAQAIRAEQAHRQWLKEAVGENAPQPAQPDSSAEPHLEVAGFVRIHNGRLHIENRPISDKSFAVVKLTEAQAHIAALTAKVNEIHGRLYVETEAVTFYRAASIDNRRRAETAEARNAELVKALGDIATRPEKMVWGEVSEIHAAMKDMEATAIAALGGQSNG